MSIQNFNVVRVTATSFLAYFVLSAIISPLGIISQPIAAHYSVSITTATAVFSALTSGIFVGSIVAIFIFDYLQIRTVVTLTAMGIGLSLASIYLLDGFFALSVCLFVSGLGCGIALSTAAVVISKTYNERLRASMLLLTDSAYSGGATLSTFLAVYLLSQNWHWWTAYLLAIVALVILLVLALPSTYPQADTAEQMVQSTEESVEASDAGQKWPLPVFLCGASLLMYMLGLVTIYSWVPNFAQVELGFDQAAAGNLVGRLFSGMFIGQLIMFLLVLRLPIKSLVLACMLFASTLTLAIWFDTPSLSLDSNMFILGIIGGGILKVAISYGTTLTVKPSPKMVSYLLFNTALGTAIAPALSAWVVENYQTQSVMVFASLCYITAVILLIATYLAQTTTTSHRVHTAH